MDNSLPANQQVVILFEKASKFFLDKRYTECVEILDKSISIDCKNFDCIRLCALANYYLKIEDLAKADFEVLLKEKKFLSEVYYYLGNIIKKIDREKAISYWLKAKEFQNDKAQIQIDFYYTCTEEYLLDYSSVGKKINFNLGQSFFIDNEKYNGGLFEIDKRENLVKLKTEIRGYENGLHILLIQNFKIYHIAIAFHEINDIKYNLNDKIFELNLMGGIFLKFTYDQSKHSENKLKKLCEKAENATGKKTEAMSSWTE